MADKVVKVGLKGRHVRVPEGWHHVTDGVVKEGDRFWHLGDNAFRSVESDDIGSPAIDDGYLTYDLLIRKNP